jgi:large subunit ribosomal protein L25
MKQINIQNRKIESQTLMIKKRGFVPGTIYGQSIKNTPIKAKRNELKSALTGEGEIYQVMSGRGPIFVKFGEIQVDPDTQEFTYFSLVQMNLENEKSFDVPIYLKGQPVGVKKGGVLHVIKDDLVIDGEPSLIPLEVIGNVSEMEIGDKLTVDDLDIPNRVSTQVDESQVIAICKPPEKSAPLLDKEAMENLFPSYGN